MTTTWNVEERHLEYLTYTVEKMEAAGEKPYAVVFTERDSWAWDHTIKTLWKEEFGTLEDILHGFEADPHPFLWMPVTPTKTTWPTRTPKRGSAWIA